MKFKILIALLLLAFDMVSAQISRHIDIDRDDPFERRKIFSAVVEFKELPSPTAPVTVDFTLKVTEETAGEFSKEDWVIKLYYYDNTVRITGDTVFTWPGPHKVGDTFVGSFEFMPLRAGLWRLSFGFAGRMRDFPNTVEWCFDEDGVLKYLGPPVRRNRSMYDYPKVTFFNNDEVVLKEFSREGPAPFEYEIVMMPAPRVGDTATVHFYLTAKEDIGANSEITLETFGMSLPSPPEKFNLPVDSGQYIEYTLQFVPQPVRDVHKIKIRFKYLSLKKNLSASETIGCNMIFDSFGNLKYIRDWSLGGISSDKYAANLPMADSQKSRKRIKIHEDEDKIKWQWEVYEKAERSKRLEERR